MAAHVGDCHVSSLRANHIEAFFYGPGGLHETCQATTLANYRTIVRSFLRFCERREWTLRTMEQLTEGLKEKSTQTNRNRYRMTREEVLLLLEAAKHPRDRALIAFLANTGLRISEAVRMRVRDVSFNKGELYVYLPKTKEEVTVPLSLDLERELRAWLRVYTEEVGALKRSYYLFPVFQKAFFLVGHAQVPNPVRLLNPEGWITSPTYIIKDVAEAAGIELDPGDAWHTLRRSFARILYEDAREHGHDNALRIVQAALNHKEVSTTERYLGLDIERQRYAHMIKGKPFLTANGDGGKIVPLAERRAGRG
ncbi:tyrosine-type recombinase/integrase [Streptomyces sp. MBT98]|nr:MULTISPECIES: tyrosine-type recombinase/integrase [unclassified Streptomyces]MBK3601053.1 tyrosine-type recombinase/integrase [Streptomyces sp. MBT54]MBK3613959.1 tyrosine-type recombinase/integrase [Streptomyces sp. MBT98]MBK6041976.1 tyrosine-type recombinase/integrase [Streptomyces sp. MBT55]